jgi:hypothetical protein
MALENARAKAGAVVATSPEQERHRLVPVNIPVVPREIRA